MSAAQLKQQTNQMSAAGSINLADAARVQQYLSQFGITGWVGRDIKIETSATANADNYVGKAISSNTDINKNPIAATTSIATRAAAKENKHISTEVSTARRHTDINKNPPAAKANNAERQQAKQEPPASIAASRADSNTDINKNIRLGAIAYEEVLVLYKLEQQANLQADERQLLEKMLTKCGIKPDQYAKEQLLIFPPLLSHIARNMEQNSSSEQAWQQCCSGFINALLQTNNLHSKPISYILLLGDETYAQLPQQIRGGKQQCIVIKDLRTMLDDPTTRKHTWELLAPLREYLASAA